jgi:glycosyltransferase involved in cell wall biosynthesis
MWSESFSIKEYLQKRKLPKFFGIYSKNIYLFYPTLLIPFRRFKAIQILNEKLIMFLFSIFIKVLELRTNFQEKILWIFYPDTISLTNYLKRNWKVIYDCVDLYKLENRKNINAPEINERRLCKLADLVVANSNVLVKHLSKYTKEVRLVPQGFRLSDFSQKNRLVKKLHLKKPVIGYVGGLNSRLDINLLYSLAERNQKWNFVIWGPLLEKEMIDLDTWNKMQKLISLPNVITGKSKDKKEIPGIISRFDIGMIPYDISQNFNKYCYPMKLFEYFYMGKPVVSVDIIELRRFPHFIKIANSPNGCERAIAKFLSKPWPKKYKEEQIKLAKENSWQNKVEKIISML